MIRVKSSIGLICFLIVTTITVVKSQSAITEGKITYEISFPDMELDKAYKALNPTGSVVYFKDNKSRTELIIGMGIYTASILDAKNGEIITLTDMMGTKNAMIVNGEKKSKAKDKKTPEAEITVKDDTMDIAGYNCKHATIKTATTTTPVDVFYTDKIKATMQINREWNGFSGFPLAYTLEMSNGITMMMTAISVTSETVNDSLFAVPSDYQVITPDQMNKMLLDSTK